MAEESNFNIHCPVKVCD